VTERQDAAQRWRRGDDTKVSSLQAPARGDAEDFVSRVLSVVETIPPGMVMTYGEVAAAIGSRSARGVGQTMAYYGSDVPWWRVVRASGHPPLDHSTEALQHYRAEGTPLKWSGTVYRVDLVKARFRP
jgi:alkylated DNA nucleotide flippase Atl1